MPGFVFLDGHVVAQAGVQAHVRQGIIGGVEGRGQVIISLRHQDLHERILGKGGAQAFAGIGKPAALIFPVTVDLGIHDFVFEIGLVTERPAQVLIEDGGIGRRDGLVGRVEVEGLPLRRGHDANEARIQATDRSLLIAQQFLAIAHDIDAQIGAQDEARTQAGVSRQTLGNSLPLIIVKAIPLCQRHGVFTVRPVSDFRQQFAQIAALQILIPAAGDNVMWRKNSAGKARTASHWLW